jgi:hypothetical protein
MSRIKYMSMKFIKLLVFLFKKNVKYIILNKNILDNINMFSKIAIKNL